MPESVSKFWVDEQRLYWSVYPEYTLRSCLKTDCARTTISYGQTFGSLASIGGKDLYWVPESSHSKLVTCPKAGCRGTPSTLFQDTLSFNFVFKGDGDYIYWNSSFDIYRCPNAGCAATPEVVAANERASELVVGADHIYWQRPREDSTPDLRIVLRAPKDGAQAPQQVLSLSGFNEFDWLTFASGPESIYWVSASGHLLSCPLAGCGDSAPTELVTTNQQKHSLHVDDTGLYWVEGDFDWRSKLHFCRFDQCPSNESILVIDKPLRQFELDENFVYFSESSNDGSYPTRVERIGKPRPAP